MTTENQTAPPRRGIYINRKKPIVTYILMGICITIFIIDQISGYLLFGKINIGYLSAFGMKINDAISQGQVWRLLTSVFLHADIAHIGFNMYALYIWGKYCETLFGRRNYLFVFLLAGLFGSFTSYALIENPGLGASGAIYGLFGALIYFRKFDKELFNKLFGSRLLIFLAISLSYGFRATNIDNAAHLGGLLGGFLVANIFGLFTENKSERNPKLWVSAYISLCIILGYIGYYL